ncbi:hypothetical protein [Phytomonospora endophytica]|uniref:Uncharacterized protein n=1 Tax=Phytomonospora endophytica TaxID=714109 RepID=A0A841F9X1_9ACTN|nr:hypothetical protein [Phytomonospora endophytica]MBB6032534.1 hypothetical protein [Phytomonospora endophytica]GIG66316.1 hypothetical protein Pen01_26110 [Phytomonospora endophytica]
METLRKKTQNRRTVLVMAVITILGYVVWVATYQPTPFDRFQAADPRGASACTGLEHWLEDPDGALPVLWMNAIGYNASLSRTPSIRATAGLVENDDRFAAFRDEAVLKQYRIYGYGRGHDYADDLAALDGACAAQGLPMPAYRQLM